MIELHHGSISAFSEGLGRGSTIAVRVPLSTKPIEETHVPATESSLATGKTRVLIIEDQVDAARILQQLIQLLGYEVDYALNGDVGLQRIREQHPDVVISDLGLPGDCDGYLVARTVRAEGILNDVTLIALSGYGQEEDRRKALESGFDHFCVKPVDFETLKSLLDLQSTMI